MLPASHLFRVAQTLPHRRNRVPLCARRSSASRPLGSRRVTTGGTWSQRWRHGKRGWPAIFPVMQFPNAPLLVALAGLLVAAVTDGSAHAYARAVFYAALAAWAWK